MTNTTPLEAWLRLALTPGVGGTAQRALLKAFGLPDAIFSHGMGALREVVGLAVAERLLCHAAGTAAIETALRWAALPGNTLLTLADVDYPRSLLDSADPPILLYVKGRTELLNRPMLAIVGSRHATPQGIIDASAFARSLADTGLTIVSGLALGIDAAAHRGALDAGKAGGSTVAVIGTGADRIYPARHRDLAHRLAAEGVIVSEFPLDTPARASNFPRRNRLIAGLAQGCLVIEAAARSGSLITARLAGDMGREVFAIPGSIHSPLAKGCHQLIRQGAKLVETAEDVLEELRWPVAPIDEMARVRPSDGPDERDGQDDVPAAGLLQSMGYDPCSTDTLIERTGLTLEGLLAMLLPLELDGQVASLPGGRYQRIRCN